MEPKGKISGELLLPGAPQTAGIRFCCPVRPEPRLSLITLSVRTQLCSNRERLVIVGTCRFESFYGALRPGKNTVFQHTSILVRPHVEGCFHAPHGGAAGYRPRVRCIYSTASFIAIAGRTRHDRYRMSERIREGATSVCKTRERARFGCGTGPLPHPASQRKSILWEAGGGAGRCRARRKAQTISS